MEYFGIEIYDGKPLKPMNLDEELTLEEQWYHLTEDITCIDFEKKNSNYKFSIDVGWHPEAEVTPESYFRIDVDASNYPHNYGLASREKCNSIASLKTHLVNAVELVRKLQLMSEQEVEKSIKSEDDYIKEGIW